MVNISRRGILFATGAGVAGAVLTSTAACSNDEATPKPSPPDDYVSIASTDPRYQDLLMRGYNRRIVGKPENIVVTYDEAQVRAAVDDAVAGNKVLAVRSGGHGLDDTPDAPDVQTVIDLGQMDDVFFDRHHNAFSVGTGVTLGALYKKLDLGWGVTVPGGGCPSVGIGGHLAGGGFGPLSRLHGLAADHLYGVEVVTVGSDRKARSVLATRNPDDPNRDLWWAHTGGGGGSFGIATRYLLRARDTSGDNPSELLPKRPTAFTRVTTAWKSEALSKDQLATLVGNFSRWCLANSAATTNTGALWGSLLISGRDLGRVLLVAQIDPSDPASSAVLTDFISTITANVPSGSVRTEDKIPWQYTTVNQRDSGDAYNIPASRLRSKTLGGGYFKAAPTTRQSHVLFDYLCGDRYTYSGISIVLLTWGGALNSVRSDDTATPQRDSSMLLGSGMYWSDQAEDSARIAWMNEFYRDLFAESGGVPALNDRTDGCYINWPDADLADPAVNKSGVLWSELYHGNNYAGLQAVKKKWDPNNIFRRKLGVTAL